MGLPFDPVAEAGRNWRANRWPGTEAMAAATSITRAHQILAARIDEAVAPFGLNFSRFEALALLFFSRRGELPLGKIGDRLQVHPASVTNTIDRLERDGLVTRVAHDTDRRMTLACLTEKGRRVVSDASLALGEVEFGLAGMSGDERRQVTRSLEGLRRQAGDF